jgi:hypothetical protein
MAAGACGPSFEARREERRALQDNGGVVADLHRCNAAGVLPNMPVGVSMQMH